MFCECVQTAFLCKFNWINWLNIIIINFVVLKIETKNNINKNNHTSLVPFRVQTLLSTI